MGRLFRYVLYLVVLCALVVAGYALIGDLPAPPGEVVKPISVDLG